MADGTRRHEWWHPPLQGTPQGGVSRPLLANIYMHRY